MEFYAEKYDKIYSVHISNQLKIKVKFHIGTFVCFFLFDSLSIDLKMMNLTTNKRMKYLWMFNQYSKFYLFSFITWWWFLCLGCDFKVPTSQTFNFLHWICFVGQNNWKKKSVIIMRVILMELSWRNYPRSKICFLIFFKKVQ